MEEHKKRAVEVEVKIGTMFGVDDEMNGKVDASSPAQNFFNPSANGLWSRCMATNDNRAQM